MTQFKLDDKVRRKQKFDGHPGYGYMPEGKITDICRDGYVYVDGKQRDSRTLELVWQPQNGEMVEVSKDYEKWYTKKYIGALSDGRVVCEAVDNSLYTAWEYCRPIQTHTITIDGTDYEVSAELCDKVKGMVI